MEYLRSTLPASNHSDAVGFGFVRQEGRQRRAVARRMQDPGVLGERGWDLRLPSNRNDDLPGFPCRYGPSLGVPREDGKAVDHRTCRVSLAWDHVHNFLIVGHDILEPLCAPPHVIFELQPRREERSQVHKPRQPVLVLEIVEERELAARVAERCQILDEGYLHPGAGDQHPGMPGKLRLFLEEAHLGLPLRDRFDEGWIEGIVQGDGYGKARGTETNANEVMQLILGHSFQSRWLWRTDSGSRVLLATELGVCVWPLYRGTHFERLWEWMDRCVPGRPPVSKEADKCCTRQELATDGRRNGTFYQRILDRRGYLKAAQLAG